jgi:DNA-binding NtrC family response regulator
MHSYCFFLIVSRSPDLQDAYVQVLRSQRVPAVGVDNCEDAVAVTHLVRLGAALFDVDRRDDWNTLAEFRQRCSADVPIVALSGCLTGDRTFQDLARGLGCAGFVAKPAAAELVVRALQRAAAGTSWSEYVE